jgi:tryptophan halogenase
VRGAIRSIAVLGDGITGWSAAAAFARALPQLRVTIVPAEPDPAALADRLPGSTSFIHGFHAAIGLDEADLIRAGAAVPRIGIRFEHWGTGSGTWFHVHGEHGKPAGSIPFHHYWARAWRDGNALPYYRYATAGVMAEADRFVHPQPDARLADYDYGLRIDPAGYRRVLGRHAAALGAHAASAPYAGAERRADGTIAALALADSSRVEADLFIDASGPSAVLLRLLDEAFEDWSSHYPCRWLAMDDAPPEPPSPVDTIEASADRWRWRAPLFDRTIVGTLGSTPGEGAVALRPGRRPAPWTRNVLAIGDAALALDPLHSLPLHAAQSAVLRALELLPGRACNPVETREYNRRALLESDRLRDFQLLHHRTTQWNAASSAGLDHMLQQFEARGRFVPSDEDSLPREIWLAALLGLGVLPRAMDPLADTIPTDLAAHGMAELAESLPPLIGKLPVYRDYLARMR